MVLGMQWLQGIDKYIIDHRMIQLEFIEDGKNIVLRALLDGGPKEVSSRRMETIIRYHDIL